MKDDELKRVIANLKRCDRNPDRAGVYTFDNAVAAIEQLFKERDEARREVCRLMSMFNAENSVEIAASRSWDCFKEEADHNNNEFKKGRMK